jgi:segregation and condensation protein B
VNAQPEVEEPVEVAPDEPVDVAAPEPEVEQSVDVAAPEPEVEQTVDVAEPEPEVEQTVDPAVAEPEEEPDLVPTASAELPELISDADLEAALESLLLVVDSPAEEELLATTVELPMARVVEALHRMAQRYTEQGSGIDLRRVGGGWRFYTRDRFAPYVEKLLLDGQRSRLTRAALETLAVIAYRQPVTRSRVAAVRGVNVDGVIRTLLGRGLIEEIGTDTDTGGFLYRTTELFLERLGLSSLDDLPPIAPLLPEVDSIDDV